MTKKEINEKLNKIAKNEDDPNMAHIYTDELWQDFIQYVADQGGEIGLMANMVLLATEMKQKKRIE
jgi:hypothetical protein